MGPVIRYIFISKDEFYVGRLEHLIGKQNGTQVPAKVLQLTWNLCTKTQALMDHRTAHLLHYKLLNVRVELLALLRCISVRSSTWLPKTSPQTFPANAGIVLQLIPQPLPSTVFSIHYLLIILSHDAYRIWPIDSIFPCKQNVILLFLHLVNLIQVDTPQWNLAAYRTKINPFNAELNPICHLLALLEGATIVVVSRLRVKLIYPDVTDCFYS
jgi:hypothetical protein